MMMTVTLEEYLQTLKAQGVPKEHMAMICPMCGTIQSAHDLIAAGAGATFDDVNGYLGYSCIGRFTHGQPPPKERGTQIGCNWTLGGLFRVNTYEVVTEDGQKHPRFAPATSEEAQAHMARNLAAAPAEPS
jgi:hypothetical protein